MRASLVIAFMSILAIAAAPAYAQSEKLFAVGVGISADRALHRDDGWDRAINYVVFRVPRPERLGIAWDIGSRTDDVRLTSSAVDGSVRMRKVLFGPGYTWRRGRLELTASALVGPVFNRLDPVDGSTATSATAKTSFGLQPDLTCWIDLSARWGFKLASYYFVTKPTLRVATDQGTFETTHNARHVRLQAGIVWGFY